MLYESPGMSLSTNEGIAALRLHFPGRAINGFHAGYFRELESVFARLAAVTGIDAFVIRSGRPDGFSTGLDPAVLPSLRTQFDKAAFARLQTRVLNHLERLPFATLAFIEGPCLGSGWDLATACDYRIAVAGPDSRIGSAEFNPRQAVEMGWLDDAFCQRRAKIELRGWLDRIRNRPKKAHPNRKAHPSQRVGRDEFQSALPRSVGFFAGEGSFGPLAAEFALRGTKVLWGGGTKPMKGFERAVQTGRVTPLEAEQALGHITLGDDLSECEFVALDSANAGAAIPLEREIRPGAILAVPSRDWERVRDLAHRPGRVIGLDLSGGEARILPGDDEFRSERVFGWLQRFGIEVETMDAIPAARELVPV